MHCPSLELPSFMNQTFASDSCSNNRAPTRRYCTHPKQPGVFPRTKLPHPGSGPAAAQSQVVQTPGCHACQEHGWVCPRVQPESPRTSGQGGEGGAQPSEFGVSSVSHLSSHWIEDSGFITDSLPGTSKWLPSGLRLLPRAAGQVAFLPSRDGRALTRGFHTHLVEPQLDRAGARPKRRNTDLVMTSQPWKDGTPPAQARRVSPLLSQTGAPLVCSPTSASLVFRPTRGVL